MGYRKYGLARADIVARWFGVEDETARDEALTCLSAPALDLCAGQIILLTGPSGAGKSSLLRHLARRYRRRARWIDLQGICLPDSLVIDAMADAQFGGRDEASILAALQALSRVGLGEVWTYLRTPARLSDGQRWRLRFAIALARAAPSAGNSLCILAADEFAAPLDRITAIVVARSLRKAVSAASNLCAIVATTREDLQAALQPDLVIHCDFGTYNHFLKERMS